MEPRQTMSTTLRTPPFAFANAVLTSYAEGVKAYWRIWGPLGQPTIQTIDIWARTQQRYLEAWGKPLFYRPKAHRRPGVPAKIS